MMKSRRVRWAKQVTRMGEKRNTHVVDGKGRGNETTMKAKTLVGG
jgi:hypothetical protein